MPQQIVRQTQFVTGEVDSQAWKRTEAPEYATSAQSLQNCEIATIGYIKKRKGSLSVMNVNSYAQLNSQLYEFVDRYGNYYLVMLSNLHAYIFTTGTQANQVVTNTGSSVITAYSTNVVTGQNSFSNVQILNTPYMTPDLDNVDYTQDNDNLILTHPSYPPARIYITSYTNTVPTFAYQALNIYPLPAFDFNNINYNNMTVSLSVSGSTLTFALTGAGANSFTTDWIGGQIIGGGATDTEPVGYAIITNVVAGGGTATFTATVQIPFLTSGYATSGNQYSVRQPAWSASLGYPARCLFFQNRLWLAATPTLNNAIFGSKINQPVSFDVGTGRDTDAIVYTLGQTNSGAIQWLNGGKQLEIFTQNYEFACPQDQNSALTPATFSVRQQSSYGASPEMKPITYINDSYYISRSGQSIINYHYNGIGLTYSSSNISAASTHLVKTPSNRALLRGDDLTQDNFIYFMNPSDNTLTTFQFATETSLAALTPATFTPNVTLVDIVTIANTVYILKYYNLANTFMIETMNNDVKMDGVLQANMASSGLITGLSLYNGYTVNVVFNENDYGSYLVVGGQITVNNPNGYSGTAFVGLVYPVNITPMYLFAGADASPLKKQVTRIYVDYYNSIDFYINGVLVNYQSFSQIQTGQPLALQTDTAVFSNVQGWDRFSTINITQNSPFDLNILGISYQIDVAVI